MVAQLAQVALSYPGAASYSSARPTGGIRMVAKL